MNSQTATTTHPELTAPVKGAKETIKAFKIRQAEYEELLKQQPEPEDDEDSESETDDSDSESECEEPAEPEPEEDEEAVLMRELEAERLAMEEKQNQRLRDIKAKKMRANIQPLRDAEHKIHDTRKEQIEAEITALKLKIVAIDAIKTEIDAGTHDERLINKQTESVSVKPAVIKKKVIVKQDGKPDGRHTPDTSRKRPKKLEDVLKSDTQFRYKCGKKMYECVFDLNRRELKLPTHEEPSVSYFTYKYEATESGKPKCVGHNADAPKKTERRWDTLSEWVKATRAEQLQHTSSKSAPEVCEYYDKAKKEWVGTKATLYEGETIN